ncbi:hypothetical protein D3C81_31950 [compost metagenome]
MNNHNGFSELLYRAWLWVVAHPLGSWGAISAFVVSVWSDLGDGHRWIESIATGFVAVFVSLGLIAVMHKSGMHEEWMPVVGMLVGIVGVDRIKTAVRGAWDSKDRPRIFGKKGDDS